MDPMGTTRWDGMEWRENAGDFGIFFRNKPVLKRKVMSLNICSFSLFFDGYRMESCMERKLLRPKRTQKKQSRFCWNWVRIVGEPGWVSHNKKNASEYSHVPPNFWGPFQRSSFHFPLFKASFCGEATGKAIFLEKTCGETLALEELKGGGP